MSAVRLMAPLTRREQRIVRACSWGKWELLKLLLEDTTYGPAQGGSSGFRIPSEHVSDAWCDYDAKGVHVREQREGAVESVAMARIRGHVRTLPDDLRIRLADFRARWRAHQVAYRPFAAPAEAIGCGPLPRMGPLTRIHQVYDDAHADWVRTIVKPHAVERRVLEAELEALLDAAFPLLHDDEPVDLLELLAADK